MTTKPTETESDSTAPEARRPKWSRKRRLSVGAIVVAVVVVVYLISLVAYSISGSSSASIGGRSSKPQTLAPLAIGASGVNIGIQLVDVDAVKNQMTVRIVLAPQGEYLDRENLSFARPVRVTIYGQSSGAISRDIKPGDALGAIEAPIYVAGSINSYPLDRYYFQGSGGTSAAFLGLTNIDAAGHPTTAVPLGMDQDISGIHGWAEDWAFSQGGKDLYLNLTLKRAGGVLAFVFVVLVLMLVLAFLAMAVAGAVLRRRRVVEPALAGWFAALLFALIPLRNFMPGAPPIGSWIDVLVFFWVELAILVGMAVFVSTWLRFGRKPGDS